MKNINKYIIPEISDFRVGYECEVQEIIKSVTSCGYNVIAEKSTYDENWKTIVLGLSLNIKY